ncbi:hypothetical protein KIW84_015700 [Lathyrus oleraceus]|uniref:Translation initiation factor beta propellor-like domain-containing protein n=1 Tax=Pisum sativum TaxID=3888 RepID=A0A9D5BR11_PEA|nr:hypothetical protein KIW84_015700 [Pisum sativum]
MRLLRAAWQLMSCNFSILGIFSKGFIYRLRVQGVASAELSSSPASHVAAFVPESKGFLLVYRYMLVEMLPKVSLWLDGVFFSRCSTTQLKWNHGSIGLLAVAQSDVDKTNQSYYGNQSIEFAVVYGFMPAKATLFDKNCNPLLELGTGPYNTIRWNPKGKFLCLAGFGNSPGDMVFWDYVERKQIYSSIAVFVHERKKGKRNRNAILRRIAFLKLYSCSLKRYSCSKLRCDFCATKHQVSLQFRMVFRFGFARTPIPSISPTAVLLFVIAPC